MIAYLEGKILEKFADSLIINVDGVGYEVFVSQMALRHIADCGESIKLSIHTHVTESAITLFGFSTRQEKNVFKKLISVNGIGPRSAMQILSGMEISELIDAIIMEDLSRLTSISGIGKKTAERMIIELKDKIGLDAKQTDIKYSLERTEVNTGNQLYLETISALINLGYNKIIAEKALQAINWKQFKTVQDLIKNSLASLSQN